MTSGTTAAPHLVALARLARAGDAPALRRLTATVRAALAAEGANRTAAAERLGISREVLLRWLRPGGVAESVGAEIPATHRGAARRRAA